MTVKTLAVENFRNLENGVLTPGEGVNILYGCNAQGKTNLIEAIFLCSGSRSFRGSRDTELVRIGQENARISLTFTSQTREQAIRLRIDSGRHAELNGVEQESPVRLAGTFCAVVFSPEHLGLVKEGPELRRKFLDGAICTLRRRHTAALQEYRKSLSQRNSLLKDIPQHAALLDTLDVWDEKLAKSGAAITFTRLRYLRTLAVKASAFYSGIAGSGEELKLEYRNFEDQAYICNVDDPPACMRTLFEALYADLRATRARDMEAGYTHAGPHRDDMVLTISGLSARSFGSQGQQRSAVLALKLAEAAVLREGLQEPPVLLLDDVMSELDTGRQEYLLNHIEGMQVFITCCDPSGFRTLAGGHVFEVNRGAVYPRG